MIALQFLNGDVLIIEKQNEIYCESKLKGFRPVLFTCIYSLVLQDVLELTYGRFLHFFSFSQRKAGRNNLFASNSDHFLSCG